MMREANSLEEAQHGDDNGGEDEISAHQVLDISITSPKQPLSYLLSFTNLTYTVNLSPNLSFSSLLRRSHEPRTKTILDDVSGEARDGQILALLGPSGSGKSTLIDALANRIARGSLDGEVLLNGETVDPNVSKAITAYVMQEDLLFPMLTVEETLMFAAEFRLSHALGDSEKKERVRTLIRQLGLQNVTNTIIGDEAHRGVSGGERRRVSIGVDMIHDPVLLFLDEPTSGLDSTSAFMVVKVLKRIAVSGRVVVMSVHQPSYRILEFLDRLIFLSRGQVVFNGALRDLPEFFLEFGHPIPDNANHVEFAVDRIVDFEDSPDGSSPLVEFNKKWRSQGNIALSVGKSSSNFRSTVSNFPNPFWRETLLLIKRSAITSRRMPEIFGSQVITILITGFMLATVFRKLDDSEKGIRERLGFFAYAMSTPYYLTCRNIPLLFEERYIIYKETAFNTYRRFSYVLAHCLGDILPLAVLSLAFASVTYWTVGLDGGEFGFPFFLLVIYGSFWAANGFVVLSSGVIRSSLVAFTTMMSVASYFLLFSGFFVPKRQIPSYWIWFHYLSTIKYSYEAVAQNEFEETSRCFARGVDIYDGTPFANVSLATKEASLRSLSASSGATVTGSTCVMRGSDVLRSQDIDELNKWNCLSVVVAWGFFFWILFYFSLLLGNKNKRK